MFIAVSLPLRTLSTRIKSIASCLYWIVIYSAAKLFVICYFTKMKNELNYSVPFCCPKKCSKNIMKSVVMVVCYRSLPLQRNFVSANYVKFLLKHINYM